MSRFTYHRTMKNKSRSGAPLTLLTFILTLVAGCHSPVPTSTSSSAQPTKKWEFSTGPLRPLAHGFFDDQSPAIAADGTLYVPGATGLYAVHPDGTQKWFYKQKLQSPAFPLHFAVIDDKTNIWFDFTVEVDRLSGGAMQVDSSGNEVPGAVSRERVSQLSESFDGTIYIAMNGSAATFRIDGKGLTNELGGYFFSFAQDGTTYAVLAHQLVAYRSDHTTKWSLAGDQFGEPALGSDGTIYVGGRGAFTAVNPDGTIKWSFGIKDHIIQSPAIATDGTVYFGADDGNLYALDPQGKLKWKFSVVREIHSTPALAKNGTVYFGGTDNVLYAIGSDGRLKWGFKTAGQVFSPTIGDDGTIYFQNAEGKLFAIQDTENNGGLEGQWPKRGAGARNTARGLY